jgi:hypothetical protein
MSHLSIDTSPENRNYQFRDRCSRWVQLGETITLPENFSIIYLPQTPMISGTGASYKGGYETGEKTLSISENIKFNKRVYDPEDWGSFRDVVITQNKIAQEPVILKIEKVTN